MIYEPSTVGYRRSQSLNGAVHRTIALRRAGSAAAAGLFCNAAAADKNVSAPRRRVKVSDPISYSGENLHAAYNFWADFNIPEIGCTGKISSGCASNKCSVRTRFFGLVINAKRSSPAPSRANKIIFVHENDRFVAALKARRLSLVTAVYSIHYIVSMPVLMRWTWTCWL